MKLVLAKQARRPRLEDRWLLRRTLGEALCLTGLDRAQGSGCESEVHIVIVDDARMTELNEQFLGHPGSTDVLAFAFVAENPLPPDDEVQVAGEIYVCLDVAVAAAGEYGNSLGEECVLYAVHGMLHLLGMDDHEPRQRDEMKAAEERVMGALRERFVLTRIFGV